MGLDPGFVLFNQIWDDGNTMGIYNQHYCGLGFNRVLSASADNQNIASNRQSDVHITVNIITGYPVSVARLLQPQVSKGFGTVTLLDLCTADFSTLVNGLSGHSAQLTPQQYG